MKSNHLLVGAALASVLSLASPARADLLGGSAAGGPGGTLAGGMGGLAGFGSASGMGGLGGMSTVGSIAGEGNVAGSVSAAHSRLIDRDAVLAPAKNAT